ncbi:unnamed protein product [Boreogadus saida]
MTQDLSDGVLALQCRQMERNTRRLPHYPMPRTWTCSGSQGWLPTRRFEMSAGEGGGILLIGPDRERRQEQVSELLRRT